MSSTCRLIYSSVARSSSHIDSESGLDNLLSRSRYNNNHNGITGCLVYSDLSFCQVLEGPADRVQTTFAKIKIDPRHRDVFVIQSKTVERRLFEHWSMRFHKSDDRVTLKSGLVFRTELERPNLNGDTLMEIMMSIVAAETRRCQDALVAH
jgi:hypothetical protein